MVLISQAEVFSQTHISLFGNIEKYMDTTEYKPIDYDCIYYFDNKIKFSYNRKKKQTYILKNDITVDSIDGYMGHYSFYNRNDSSIFLISNSNIVKDAINIYRFYFKTDKIQIIKKDFWGMVYGTNKGKLIATNKVIYNDTIIDELFYLDPDTKSLEKIIKMNQDITKYTGDYLGIFYQIYDVFSFPDSENIIIETSEVYNYEADDQEVYFNYIYNTKNKTIKELKDFRYKKFDVEIFDKNYYYSILSGNLFNNIYKYLNKGISPHYSGLLNYQIFNDKIITYADKVSYKNKYTYIPYRFVYELSTNMYKIFYGELVNEIQIQKMNQVDLKLLYNFIYAKYGLKFSSDYLNLYFYKTLPLMYKTQFEKTNKKKTEQEFTKTDKANQAIINKYIVYPDLNSYKPEQIQKANRIVSYIDTLSVNIIKNDNENYNIYYTKLKEFIKDNPKILKDKELLRQVYLQYGINIFSSNVSTPYSIIHYKVRNAVNTLSATYAYEFSNKQWLKIYKLFDWYKPENKAPIFPPSIINLTENLSKFEKEFKK